MKRQTEERTLLLEHRTTFNFLVFRRRVTYEGDRQFILYSVQPQPNHYTSNVLPELAHYPELIHPRGICSLQSKGADCIRAEGGQTQSLKEICFQINYVMDLKAKCLYLTFRVSSVGVLIAQTLWKHTHSPEYRCCLEQNFLT